MKKITLFLFFIFSWYANAQICTQTFTVTGYDDTPTILTINLSSLTCNGTDTATSIRLLNARGNMSNSFCGSWYDFTLAVDGTVEFTGCASDFNNFDITGFNTLTITSSDLDFWSDSVTITIDVEVTFTPSSAPQCVSLISPLNGANDVSSSVITWEPAVGGAESYVVSVGTTVGGTDVLNMEDVGNVTFYDIGPLEAGTTYHVSITPYNTFGSASGCSAFSFTTCGPTGNFMQDFNAVGNYEIPNCWTNILNTTNEYANVSVYNNAMEIYNSADSIADLYLVTPYLTDLSEGTHRVKFRARGASGYVLLVGTMSSPNDSSTFLPAQSISLTSSWTEYIVSFDTPQTGHYLAFKHGGGGTYRTINVDDILWEPIPTVSPDCSEVITTTVNPNCGNFATQINWSAVTGADGYLLNIGTSTGSYTTVTGLDLGNVTTYSFSGDFDTTYYFTITPYNANGSATDCEEYEFVTALDGCYCPSVPTSLDGNGIANIQIGTNNYPITNVTYTDNSDVVVNMVQGVNNNLQVTFRTGYTYRTNVWIDFNDNFTFEESEMVFNNVSLETNPTTFNASFIMPATAALGQHRMRIGTRDNENLIPDPCYSGSYGVTVDFMVNIVSPTCSPTTANATVNADCDNNQFFVAVDVSVLGDGTPIISDGTNTTPITSVGVIQMGPYASGSLVVLNLIHGSDTLCDLPLGTFNYFCPPLNDECANAIALTPGGVFNDNAIVTANISATGNAADPVPTCDGYNFEVNGKDVWFSVVVPASGSLTVETATNPGTTLTDTGLQVYSGTCGALTSINCSADIGGGNNFSRVILSGRTPGETLIARVWGYNGASGSFRISAFDASLNNSEFNWNSFKAYPNPVKDLLNLSYTETISTVAVFNLVGQQVLSKTIDNSQAQIDMSGLAQGTYIVKVIVNDQIKTIKIIKE